MEKSAPQLKDKVLFYERLLAHAPDVLIRLDWEGNIHYVSPVIEGQTGYLPAEWKAMSQQERYSRATVLELERIFKELRLLRAQGKSAQLQDFSSCIFAHYYHKNGRLLQCEIRYSIEMQGEQATGIIAVMRKHEEKQVLAQDAAIDSESLLRLIDSMPLFMAMVNTEGRYLVVNKQYARIVKKLRANIIGQHYRNVLPSDILTRHENLIQRALEGEISSFEEELSMPDGQNYYAVGRYLPLQDKNGRVIGATVFANDITKRRAAEKRLVKANKTKAKLLSLIAHDLRSPLSTLSSLLELAQNDALEPKELQHCLTELSQNLEDTSELLDNLLKWAIHQMRNQDAKPVPININELAQEQERLFTPSLKSKKLHLELQLTTDDQALVYCDREMLKVVLRNLLSNAIKFSEEDHPILLRVFSHEHEICLSVQDQGVGMSEERVQKILDSESFSTNGTRQERGTGLGLLLCQDYLRKNNGRLVIESQEGKGSCFCAYLPKGSTTKPSAASN